MYQHTDKVSGGDHIHISTCNPLLIGLLNIYIWNHSPNTDYTARCVEDETRNAECNGNRNPECWGDFSQPQIQIQQKSHFEFVPRETSKFKSNHNLNSTLYREIPRYLIFSILTRWLNSPQHSGFRLPCNSAFRVLSFAERAVPQLLSVAVCCSVLQCVAACCSADAASAAAALSTRYSDFWEFLES